MTEEQKIRCHAIIHTASSTTALIGAGLAQLPGSDSTVIVPIQITMIISLGAVFGITLDKSTAKATLATTTSTMIGRTITQFLAGWIPIIGNVVNATTASLITETIGWAIANDFANHKFDKSKRK